MKPLSQEEIENICSLYKVHRSVREVVRKSSRSTGTVHKYLSMSSVIKKNNITKEVIDSNEILIGIYVGLWLGDGTQYKDRHSYTIKICSNIEDINLNQFIQDIILKIFNKNTSLFGLRNRKSAYIKFDSKFIFDFIYTYVTFKDKNKTYTAKLKNNLDSYNKNFLSGCLLGLTLSDGSLKQNFVFSVASQELAQNMNDILIKFNFNPSFRVQKRLNKADSYIVYLDRKQSRILQEFLDKIIKKLGYYHTFEELKYGPDRI